MQGQLIGVVHVPALPGSPLSTSPIAACVERAVQDASTLEAGGADAVIVENFHDVPFRPGRVDAHTVAAMTRVCLAVREAVHCEVGVNILRNDALAALGIAAMSGANFIRVNIHTGAMLTDQGLITGEADETLRLRRALQADQVRIFADVLVKHAVPPGPFDLGDAVEDAAWRGLADVIVVSGSATGKAASVDDVERAVRAAGDVPVLVGSGITADNVTDYVPPAAGVIVGSSLKVGSDISSPVDLSRVQTLRRALDSCQGTSPS